MHAEIPLPGLAQHTSNIKTCPANAQCYEGGLENVSPSRYDALVLSGSQYSAADDLPWIRQLKHLKKVMAGRARRQISALCRVTGQWHPSHQVLCDTHEASGRTTLVAVSKSSPPRTARFPWAAM